LCGKYLAVVKSTFDSNVVDVCVHDCGHLCFLDGRNAIFGMEDEDRDVGFVPQTVDGGTDEGLWLHMYLMSQTNNNAPSSISACGTDNSQLLLFFSSRFLCIPSEQKELE